MSIIDWLKSKPKDKPETEEPPSEKCPRCGNDKCMDVTCAGDPSRRLLCGNCGLHREI